MADIKLNYALLCDHAFFSEGNKLNIIGIFGEINTPKFPTIHPYMFVVASIAATRVGAYTVVLKLVKEEDGTPIGNPLNFNLTTNKDNSRIGILGQFLNTKFEDAGRYMFEIYVNDDLIGSVPLSLN